MRNTTKALTAIAAVLLLLPSSALLAQRRRGLVDVSRDSERHGFWLSVGGGAVCAVVAFAVSGPIGMPLVSVVQRIAEWPRSP